MSNIAKLEFTGLDISGKNYLSWTLDAGNYLDSKCLGHTIKEDNNASEKDRVVALIFLLRHIDEDLQKEYLTIKDPLILWNNLKERYEHLKSVVLPHVRYDWIHLRFHDYNTVNSYNSALFRITSLLKLCGENVTDEQLLEKTLSTFHCSNMLLQQQYREKGFKKYSELISCLLVAERNNAILKKNHEHRSAGSTPLLALSNNAFAEANATALRGQNNPRGRGRGRRHGRRRGRGHRKSNVWYRESPQQMPSNINKRGAPPQNRGRNNGWRHQNSQAVVENAPLKQGQTCNKCGTDGHWDNVCRTPRHLVDLYQASKNRSAKFNESNHVDYEQPMNLKGFNVDDFFAPEPQVCGSFGEPHFL